MKMYSKQKFYFKRLTFVIFKIIGLAPFNLNIHEGGKESKIEFSCSKLGTAYNVSLSLLLASSSYISVKHIVQKSGKSDNDIVVGFRVAFVCLSNVIYGTILINHCLIQKSTTMMINRLIHLDNKMLIRWGNQYQSHCQKHIGGLIFVTNVLLHIAVRSLLSTGSQIQILYVIGPTISNFGISCFIIQYAFALIYLEHRFRTFNELLSSLYNSFEDRTESQSNMIYVSSTRSSTITVEDLSTIRTGRRILSMMSENFADSFRWPILFCIVMPSVGLIFNSYTCILRLFSSPRSTDQILLIIDDAFAIAMNIFPIIVLTYYGSKIVEEAQRTGNIVQEVIVSYQSQKPIIHELEQFSTELLHRKISFTAGVFFPIDGSLLQTMISTTITYMIILLQQPQSDKQ